MADSEDNPADTKAKDLIARLGGAESGSVSLLAEAVEFLKDQAETEDEPPQDIPAGHPALERIDEKPIPAARAAALLDTTEEVLWHLNLPRLRIAGVWHYGPQSVRAILTSRKALSINSNTYH